MAIGSEELLIQRITSGLKGIKNGTKTVADIPIETQIERLKKTNLPMAEDFEKELRKLTRGEKPKPKEKGTPNPKNNFRRHFK